MDFIIGILMVMIILLLLYNFSSISLSDTQYGGKCSSNSSTSIPVAVQSNSNKALNGKINIHDQTYDYHKYFFVK